MTERVSLIINEKRFEAWEDININLSLDSIDSFSFSTPMEADKPEFRENFAPLSYASAVVRLNDEPLLNGVLVNKETSLSGKSLPLGGYSRPGVLGDLPVPYDKYPLEFKSQTLAQIAGTLAGYYGVKALFSSPAGSPFAEGVSPEPGEKILDFLIKLAHKRNLLLTNTREGELNFFTPLKSVNITPLRQGDIPLRDARINFNEQEIYSSVTGLGAAEFGRDPESFTESIPALSAINRPFVYTVTDAKGADLQKTVKFKAGRLFANAIKISASVLGWRQLNDKIWTPGDFVALYAPNNFFYTETKLLIRNVSLAKTGSEENAELDLVFPGVYSGELPKKFPWD